MAQPVKFAFACAERYGLCMSRLTADLVAVLSTFLLDSLCCLFIDQGSLVAVYGLFGVGCVGGDRGRRSVSAGIPQDEYQCRAAQRVVCWSGTVAD